MMRMGTLPVHCRLYIQRIKRRWGNRVHVAVTQVLQTDPDLVGPAGRPINYRIESTNEHKREHFHFVGAALQKQRNNDRTRTT